MPVDRHEQCWSRLSWQAWTWLLTGLFMHVGTDCSWLDERTDLSVIGTIMIKQQPCSYMHDRTCCQGMMKWQDWRAMLQQPWIWLLYQIRISMLQHTRITPVDSPSCIHYVLLKHDWTILLFYQSCSIMLTVLLQGRANNPKWKLWYIYVLYNKNSNGL